MNRDNEIYMDDRDKIPVEDQERFEAKLADAEGNVELMEKIRAEMKQAEDDFNKTNESKND